MKNAKVILAFAKFKMTFASLNSKFARLFAKGLNARSKILTRSHAIQKLHLKRIISLAGNGAKYLQPKKRFKHGKLRHLIKSWTFFVDAHGSFQNLTTVFGRCYFHMFLHPERYLILYVTSSQDLSRKFNYKTNGSQTQL